MTSLITAQGITEWLLCIFLSTSLLQIVLSTCPSNYCFSGTIHRLCIFGLYGAIQMLLLLLLLLLKLTVRITFYSHIQD